jgi:uncharacterized repeat protein (TIGR02543 family)
MNLRSRRVPTVLLASAVLAASFCIAGPARAATTDVACGGGGTFRIEDDVLKSSTIDCVGSITVPADVIEVGERAFMNRNQITSVTFEAGSKLTRLGYEAFYRSSITSIVLPNGLDYIAQGVFAEATKFTAISIPGTVTRIDQYAFVRSDIRSLVFESRIAQTFDWGYWLLLDNPNLESVTLKGPNQLVIPNDSNFWGDNINQAKEWDGWSLTVGGPRISPPLANTNPGDLILYPKQTLKAGFSTVPCSSGGSVKIVDFKVNFVTWDCAGEVTIPANVTEISHYFRGRDAEGGTGGLTKITFEPNSQLKQINGGVFRNTAITTISIPGSVEVIQGDAFYESDLETVVFEQRTATSLDIAGAFTESKKLRSITFNGPVEFNSSPAQVISKTDHNWVGWSTTLNGPVVSYPYSITAAGGETLYPKWIAVVITEIDCSVDGSFTTRDNFLSASTSDCAGEITIPAYVTQVNEFAFDGRGLTSVSFAANSQLKTIARSAFAGNNITSLVLPDGLELISYYAFALLKVRSIVIPGTVKELHGEVFKDSLVEDVVFAARARNWDNGPASFFRDLDNVPTLSSLTFVGSHRDCCGFYKLANRTINKMGHRWDGWSTTQGGPILTTFSNFDDSQASRVIYPNWTPLTFVATFNSNGGTPVSPGTIVGGDIQLPVPPTRVGYSFLGWTEWADGGGTVITRWGGEAHTFGAKWNADSYVVNLNSKGGSVVPPGSFVTDGSISSAPSAPSRTGYTFTGWSATENGTALTFPHSPGVMENITLYAQWEKIAPVVTAGPTPNSKVVSIPAGVTEAVIPATPNLPSIKLGLSSAGGTAVATIVPTVSPTAPALTPFDASSVKIVDINITGITGSVTICIDGAATDSLFHFTGGKWEELPQRSYANGQVCGVTSNFSPFAAAPRKKAAAPTNLSVIRGDKSLSISFTPGATFGAEITRYEFSVDSGKTWTKVSGSDVKSPVTIGGLTNGMNYSVLLRAVNAAGFGADSAAVIGKPKRPLLADSAGIDVPIVKDPAVTFALNSDIAVRGNKVAVALVAPTSAKSKVTYYMFTMKPKTKGAAIVKQTYKAKAKGTTTAILTGKPKVTYTVSVTAVYANGSRKSWTGPSLTTR